MPSRVPPDDSGFDDYIKSTDTYLQTTPPGAATTNGVRLGVTAAELVQWTDYRNSWVEIYAKYVDLGQRTQPITEDKNDVKDLATPFMEKILNRLAGNPDILTSIDRETLRIPERDTENTPRPKITDAPLVGLDALKGSAVKIRTRIEEDSSRASMHPDADAIEVRFLVGNSAPANVTLCNQSQISSKALFEVQLDPNDAAKRFFCFCRWINITDAAKNGPWCTVQNTVVLG